MAGNYMYVTCFGLPKTSESIKFLISMRVYSYTFSEFKFHSCDFLGVGGFDPPFCTVRPFVSTLFNIEAASLQELFVFVPHSMLSLPVALTKKKGPPPYYNNVIYSASSDFLAKVPGPP